MKIPSIVLIEEFFPALVAHRDIGGDKDLTGCLAALDYLEIIIHRSVFYWSCIYLEYCRSLGRFLFYQPQEFILLRSFALGKYLYIRTQVCHGTFDAGTRGMARYDRTHSHALNDTVDLDPQCLHYILPDSAKKGASIHLPS